MSHLTSPRKAFSNRLSSSSNNKAILKEILKGTEGEHQVARQMWVSKSGNVIHMCTELNKYWHCIRRINSLLVIYFNTYMCAFAYVPWHVWKSKGNLWCWSRLAASTFTWWSLLLAQVTFYEVPNREENTPQHGKGCYWPWLTHKEGYEVRDWKILSCTPLVQEITPTFNKQELMKVKAYDQQRKEFIKYRNGLQIWEESLLGICLTGLISKIYKELWKQSITSPSLVS